MPGQGDRLKRWEELSNTCKKMAVITPVKNTVLKQIISYYTTLLEIIWKNIKKIPCPAIFKIWLSIYLLLKIPEILEALFEFQFIK